MSNSQSILSSFNPHAVHPFTAGASQPSAQLHHPPPTRMPMPSPPQSAQNVSTHGTTASQPPASSLSSHTHAPFPAVQSPQPRPTSKWPPQQPSSQPIFTPFKLERSSPELRDVLAKKSASSTSWPAKPIYGTQTANSVGANVGKK